MEEKKCCCSKTTLRDKKTKHDLIVRLNRIEGQIRGIKNMVEKDAYCADILVQSSAASAAINSFNREIMDSHVKGCVARDIKLGKDEVVDELVDLMHKLMK
ncbi:MAG: metal-sensing transcriptional repressor [Clostridia bacterium]|nr:metal-sensing transcriptional repressor [Clostridia bacterium]